MRRSVAIIVVLGVAAHVAGRSLQAQAAVPFDVVSIKKSSPSAVGGGSRTMPDGTTVITNSPIRGIFARGASEPVRDIENLPDWAMEFYDITVKPPQGAPRAAIPDMWRAMLADRFKLRFHIDHRETDGYALVLARGDGRLGPNLKPSALDCSPKPDAPAPQPPATFPTRQEGAAQCGMLGGRDYVVSGGMPMSRLALLVSDWIGGSPVVDRTGLAGFYAVELNFPPSGPRASTDAADPASSDQLTAVREQLGLTLKREKITIPVLVIDHIERPTEN